MPFIICLTLATGTSAVGVADTAGTCRLVRAAAITNPMLLMKSGFAPYSSGPLTLREEPSSRPNVSIVHFENTGHVIYRDRFDTFIERVREFFGRV